MNAQVDTGVSSIKPTGLGWNANTLSVNVAGLRLQIGEMIVITPAVSPVPEPSAAWLLATGLPVLGGFQRRRLRPAV